MPSAPPFDPSKPFDVVTEAPPFDPSKPFEDATVPAQPPIEQPPAPSSWADVGTQALANAPESAKKFATDIVQPLLHPVETGKSLYNVGRGVVEKAAGTDGKYSPYADVLFAAIKDRYGSVEAFKRTLATDPVGALSDLSIPLTGGTGAAARLPGVAGRVGQIAAIAARTIDPVSAAVGGAKLATKGVTKIGTEAVGALTGTGGESIRQAVRSGLEGGESARALRENMRGNVPTTEVVDEARTAVGALRKERGAEYTAGMAPVKADTTVLNFAPIENAVTSAFEVKRFKGQSISPSTERVQSQLGELVQRWKALNPADFHTAEGLDALKQAIGDIRDATQYGTPERRVADQVYQNIRGQIIKQVPEYAKTMRDYEMASKQINEVERTLSLSPGANVDTALRKLQSIMRNNVNANFGRRAELADRLVEAGAANLLPALAGQTLNTWAPRGLARLALPGAMTAAGATLNPLALAGIPLSSPRLVGEAAYLGGRVASPLVSLGREFVPAVRPTGRTLVELGRLTAEDRRAQHD